MRINRISKPSRMTSVIAALSATALVLVGCSSESGDGDNGGGDDGAAESYSIGITQLVQHPALDASAAGFKAALEAAGGEVKRAERDANGEQSSAVTRAQ